MFSEYELPENIHRIKLQLPIKNEQLSWTNRMNRSFRIFDMYNNFLKS